MSPARTRTTFTTAGRVVVVLATLAAGVGGWWAMHRGDTSTTGSATASALPTVALTGCPGTSGAPTGSLVSGAPADVVGRGGATWAVVLDPARPDELAWLPLAAVTLHEPAAALPDIACDAAMPSPTTVPTATTSTAAAVSATTTTLPFVAASTTVEPAPTTVSGDHTPPTVTLTANRPYLYTTSIASPCADEDTLEVDVAVADPTRPLSVRSIGATWTNAAGAQSANLRPLAGNRFELAVPAGAAGTAPIALTITATATDGAGNVGTGSLTVELRDPLSGGCAG